MKTVCVSGGFDPFHAGHLALIQEAAKLGSVVAIVDSDEYVASKHRVGLPQPARKQIVRQFVYLAIANHTANGDCSPVFRELCPDYYVVGPEYTDHTKLPEYETCKRLGIEIVTAQHEFADLHSRDFAKPQYVNPPVTVSAIITDQYGMVLTINRKEDGSGRELPGGFLDEGESLEMALRREAQEELVTPIINLQYFTSKPAYYSDGRKIVSVYFTARLDPTFPHEPFCEGHWVRQVPDCQFYAECDRQALIEYFIKQKGQ